MTDAPQNLQQLTPEQQAEMQEKLKNMSPEELMEFQKQQCIFCQIISGKIPSKKLYDDEKCIAILDINPAAKGHILILPKEHYAIMPQMPGDVIAHMFIVAKKMSQLLLKGLRVDGTSIYVANGLVAGQKAQHFIIHVIPRSEGDGLLAIEEHFADKAENEKIIVSVGNRLNELLGIKKEVVKIDSKKSDVNTGSTEDDSDEKEETTADNESDKEDMDESDDEESDKDSDEDDDDNEEPDEEEDNSEDDDTNDDDTDEPEEKEEADDDEESDKGDKEEEDEDDTNLDDIANLFK